ncbi:hypothetical protein TNIN_16251 [Trichonephila inaurata madagascariensis]|uniref:Uncharacterized protein n=1 Tax=Trichonephila inaurata madagascariensis TaxID=2747483 RepID=A0A8X6XC18_9ARAC|nr:hypothetical protein TNIN_16251 [Trichonephila inaurata madagascariensis]
MEVAGTSDHDRFHLADLVRTVSILYLFRFPSLTAVQVFCSFRRADGPSATVRLGIFGIFLPKFLSAPAGVVAIFVKRKRWLTFERDGERKS